MSDLRRYLDDNRGDRLARDLLRSGEGDEIDDARADALLRAIHARTGMPLSPSDSGSLRTPPAPPSGSRLALFTTVAVVAAGGALLTYIETRAPSSPATPATPVIVAVAPSAPVLPAREVAQETAPAAEAVPVAHLPDVMPVPVAAPSSRGPAPQVTKAAAPTPPTTDLAGEVRALERVRVALAERRVADAREGLHSYERAFPSKLLEKEARALEIEALLAEGRREEAEALARVFLATSGDTPYATRVRSLIGAPRLP